MADADALAVAATKGAGRVALPATAVLGGQRALETLDHMAGTGEAEAMKMTGTGALHVNTTGCTTHPHLVTALHPAPPLLPDLGPKIQSLSPNHPAPSRTSTPLLAPRNRPVDAPTQDLCPDLAPDPRTPSPSNPVIL